MKLEQSFEVSAPLQRVWEALIDVERVAPCLPGAAVTGRNDDGSYNGEFKVKIGPTSASYAGKLNMESVDETAHQAVMQAAGTDKRGQGGAKATIQSSVEEAGPGSTKVNVSTDYHITGRLARFGRGGMIEEISNRLLREFASNLQAMVGGAATETGAAASAAAGVAGVVAAAGTVAAGGSAEDAARAGRAAGRAAADDAGAAGVAAAGETARTEMVETEPGETGQAGEAGAAGGAAAAAGAPGGAETAAGTADQLGTGAAAGGAAGEAVGSAEKPQAARPEAADEATAPADSGASAAEVAAAGTEPPVPQAGSQGEPGDPAHATEATAETDVSSGRAGAPADDPFAPPVPPPPPSGAAAGAAPPPPSSATSSGDNEPLDGMSLVGGALVAQVKSNPVPFVGGLLVALLVVLRLVRRRGD
jgi:uncharacterized protein